MNSRETRVLELLDALGNTGSEIAVTLAAKGIKVVRCRSDSCPISNYLTSEGMSVLAVTDENVVLRKGGNDFVAPMVPLPRQVADFVHGFDDGEYPELAEVPS